MKTKLNRLAHKVLIIYGQPKFNSPSLTAVSSPFLSFTKTRTTTLATLSTSYYGRTVM